MKKRLIALILLMCMLIGAFPVSAAENTAAEEVKMKFVDVDENHSAYNAILYLFQNGIINGKSETLFCPNDFLKREELAKILSLGFKLSDSNNSPVFYDVPAGIWYAPFVQLVSATGFMKGVSETQFGTGSFLSRQDMAVILHRFLEKQKVDLTSQSSVVYADDEKIADYAKKAINSLSAVEVMEPRDNNLWCPTASITRAETAQALYNALTLRKKQSESKGRYGDASQYNPPYTVTTDDKLAELMPVPFDVDIWPRKEIIYEDFEDEDYGVLKRAMVPSTASFSKEGGYNGGGCLVMKGSDSGALNTTFSWKADASELAPGDFLVFSAMIKGEGTSGSGHYRGRMSIYNEKNEWLDETHTFQVKKDSDWTEYQYTLMVPETVNALKEPEFFTVNLHAYILNMTGTISFDDFKLYKVEFTPMDTVLMTPNYKGIIKGEDGVGDISLRAYVNELNGLYDLNDFKMTSQIVDAEGKVYANSESDTVTSVMDVYFSSKDLPMGGDYWIETIITYKETGEELQRQEWRLHKREADFETEIGIDEYGRVTRNGEPYFPISVYNWMNYDDIYDIAESGVVDNVNEATMQWYYNYGTDESHQKWVQMLEDKDMTVSFATGSMAFSNIYTGVVKERVKQQTDVRGLLEKLVNNYKDLPNLFSYYIFDEQNAMRYGEELAWVREIIEQNDLDHPTMCAIDNPIFARPGICSKTSDFLGYDPYPATGKPNQNLAMVYNRLSEAKKLNPNRPIYAILQLFWYSGRGDLRGPTKDEYRNMAFQAILAGSCMLDAYAYSEAYNYPSPGKAKGEEWKEWAEVYEEIQYLEPIILSVDPTPYYEVKGGDKWLNTMARRYDGKSYLFTVNNTNAAQSAMIYLDGVKKIKGMYSKKEYEADDSGCFEIEWDAYETEVFEYEQSDYKSPHAELTTFGLTDSILGDAESEVSFFTVPQDKIEFDYNARISDYATLYINGEKVENIGKLNLEELSEINVKVLSEDGRFKTEKTFLIKRS